MKIVSYVILTLTLVNISFAEEKTEWGKFFPQQMTAKALMMACASSYMTSTGRQRQKYCSGFISGVEESIRLLGKQAIVTKTCLPKGKTSSQYTDIYITKVSGLKNSQNKPIKY